MKNVVLLLLMVLSGGCAFSDVRMTAGDSTFRHNEQVDTYDAADRQAVPVANRKVFLKSLNNWCKVGSNPSFNEVQWFFTQFTGHADSSYKLQTERLQRMIRGQLEQLGMDMVDSEADADFVLTMKLEHEDVDIILENAPTILSLFTLYPLAQGEACQLSGSLVDRRSGSNEIVTAFDSWEGLRKGEKPIRTDVAVHVTPVSIVIHTPINFLFKKDLLEAGTYLDNQVVNGYVARVRELQRQGMFY